MKKILRTTCTALAMLMSFTAYAVEYTFPADGWYQLQDPVNYNELCTSSSTNCNVPAGQYVLINHSVLQSAPNHRENITIGEPNPEPNPAPNTQYRIESTMVTQSCENGFPGRPLETDDQPCVAYCPQGYSVTGGSCKASRLDTYVDNRDGRTFGRRLTVRVPTNESLQDGGYACELDKGADYNPNMLYFVANNFTRTQLEAQAICSTIVTE